MTNNSDPHQKSSADEKDNRKSKTSEVSVHKTAEALIEQVCGPEAADDVPELVETNQDIQSHRGSTPLSVVLEETNAMKSSKLSHEKKIHISRAKSWFKVVDDVAAYTEEDMADIWEAIEKGLQAAPDGPTVSGPRLRMKAILHISEEKKDDCAMSRSSS